jgi:EAL domain-containing protein (putative c-di-GMP-specific phosphodiesterase class I)/FixJ family two-component response regulator
MNQVETERQPGESGSKLCCLIDAEVGVRHVLSAVLQRFEIDVEAFDTVAAFLNTTGLKPDLVIVDVTTSAPGALELIGTLAQSRISCPVQILSGLNPVLIEQVRRHGERGGLNMLPVIPKPLKSAAIRRAVSDLGLRCDAAANVEVSLREIMTEGWLELWYQPTINLRERRMVGAEAFARARHPDHGVLTPETFMHGASETDLLDLTRRVLGRAMQDWPAFATLGIPVELSINVPVVALSKLSIFAIMWEKKPDSTSWPGLTLEITEQEAIANLPLINKSLGELRSYGISISVDNFALGYSELSRLRDLPFKDIKIDRDFISNCDRDPVNRGLCETFIEFAHKFNLTAVADGIETPAELATLRDMGCDLGQGYLFAKPLPKNELLSMVKQRQKARPAAA